MTLAATVKHPTMGGVSCAVAVRPPARGPVSRRSIALVGGCAVMIAPDGWSRFRLRRRRNEARPSRAFEISSVSGGTEPRDITPETSVWR